jgi:hypothetical protein
MQHSPDRHSSYGTQQPQDCSILPFASGNAEKSNSKFPIGIIDLDQSELPEISQRLKRARGKYQARRLEADLSRLVDELDWRFDQLDAQLSAALSLAEAD